jgi:hypothetical protein
MNSTGASLEENQLTLSPSFRPENDSAPALFRPLAAYIVSHRCGLRFDALHTMFNKVAD